MVVALPPSCVVTIGSCQLPASGHRGSSSWTLQLQHLDAVGCIKSDCSGEGGRLHVSPAITGFSIHAQLLDFEVAASAGVVEAFWLAGRNIQ